MDGNISQILVINSSMKHILNTSTKLIYKNASGRLIKTHGWKHLED